MTLDLSYFAVNIYRAPTREAALTPRFESFRMDRVRRRTGGKHTGRDSQWAECRRFDVSCYGLARGNLKKRSYELASSLSRYTPQDQE
jgi:hypothetical protein